MSSVAVANIRQRAVRILVADASDDTRLLYRVALQVAGCEVLEAADGRDALVKALAQPRCGRHFWTTYPPPNREKPKPADPPQ